MTTTVATARPKFRVGRSLRALSALAMCVALGGAGCARRETAVIEGIRTKTLIVGNATEPLDLDPHGVPPGNDMCIMLALFEGLTAPDEKTGAPVPAAAEHWDISDDGLTYTFHLRPAACWSNGDPLTAQDFVFSFRRILQPELAALYSYMLYPIKNAEAFNKGRLKDFSKVGATAVDARTLRITLEHPTPYLPAMAMHNTWMPVHRATLEKFGAVARSGTKWTRPGNLIGNGAFTLAEWQPNARVVVAKNPRYWDAAHVQLARLVFVPIDDDVTEEQSFRAGQLHVTFNFPPAKLASYRAEPVSRLRTEQRLDTRYLEFNTTKPPLNDRRVRRALALALPRDEISRTVFSGLMLPSRAVTPPGCGGYTCRAQVPDDFAAARRLLADAGFPEGRGLPELHIKLNGTITTFIRAVEVVQATWKRELGVRLIIEPSETKSFWQDMESKNFQLAWTGWVADYNDPLTFLSTLAAGSGNNHTGWSDATYDQLIARSEQTADPQARLEIFQQAEARLLDEAPVAPFLFATGVYLVHPAVKNLPPMPQVIRRYQYVRLEAN